VGEVKKKLALDPVDAEREAQQAVKYRALAVRHGLNPELVVRLFRTIVDEVVVNHRRT
jgi:chorismate mutase